MVRIEYQCSHCKRWFEDEEKTPKHIIRRGTDRILCFGSGRAPRGSRTVYSEG